MNITHVITTIERGGAEKAVLSLAIAQAKYGHRVRVIPLKGITELADDFLVNNIEKVPEEETESVRNSACTFTSCRVDIAYSFWEESLSYYETQLRKVLPKSTTLYVIFIFSMGHSKR